MKQQNLIIAAIALIAATSIFTACGDDVTKIIQVDASGVPVVAAGEEIPSCESVAQGNMIYVEDSLAVYYCSGKEWLPVRGENGSSGENGESCTVASVKDGFKVLCGGDSVGVLLNGAAGVPGSSGSKGDDGASCTLSETENGYDVLCGDKKVGELSNGSDGAPGSAGSKGDEGASCTVKETSTGYDVLCGDKKVGELSNGSNGAPGSAGSKGDDCTLTDNGDGTITQKCGEEEVTLYKALCGTAPYDPAGDKFCYGVTLYDKCGGKAYDVNAEECVDSEVVTK